MILETMGEQLAFIKDQFAKSGVPLIEIDVKQFPGERIFVAKIAKDDSAQAMELAGEIDASLSDAFMTIKVVENKGSAKVTETIASIHDSRVTKLIELLSERSRTSEQQPSLVYVKEVSQNINVALTRRHHLIFGRRGVGKTALMVEAKRLIEERGDYAFWTNLQTFRALDAEQAFLAVAKKLCDLPLLLIGNPESERRSAQLAINLSNKLEYLLRKDHNINRKVGLIAVDLQQLLATLCEELQKNIYLFFDDMHYMYAAELPRFLDLVHASTRDTKVWLKISGIRHQCRWWTDNPPMGLQTGHDAWIIDLDITLENPTKAKEHLTAIVKTYTENTRIPNITGVISSIALDRLILASGGVPRDFLLLAASAIQLARQRERARLTGVQDVNAAAGQAQRLKMQELEEDSAASIGQAGDRIDAFNIIADFVLGENEITYFRVDFRDKEKNPGCYRTLQSIMDLRMIHLIHSSLSDQHRAGARFEVYMLDLSKFSDHRLKRKLLVLDFVKGHLAVKDTGAKSELVIGDTSRRLLDILRRGPILKLTQLTPIAA